MKHILIPLSWPQPLLIADKHDCLFSLAEVVTAVGETVCSFQVLTQPISLRLAANTM